MYSILSHICAAVHVNHILLLHFYSLQSISHLNYAPCPFFVEFCWILC